MVVEGEDGKWLLAKARQLKERALGTADTTRRKQFLLIATEYQKLAHQEDGGLALDAIERAIKPSNRTPRLGVVTQLPFVPQPATTLNIDGPPAPAGRSVRWFKRPEVVDMVIWAFLALVAFGLLLMPGDQTALGLREVFELLIN